MTFLFLFAVFTASRSAPVKTVDELVPAVKDAKEGSLIELAAGTFRLAQPLDLASGISLKGEGIGKTILTNADTWQANPATLPDPETNHQKFDRSGYLIRCRTVWRCSRRALRGMSWGQVSRFSQMAT